MLDKTLHKVRFKEFINWVSVLKLSVYLPVEFFDLANKYEILNSDGIVVLFAGEIMERFGVGKSDSKSTLFDVTILGLDGSALLSIISRHGVC